MQPEIRGYRGDVRDVRALVRLAADVTRETGAPVQLARADRLYGREHLARAVELAGLAFDAGRNAAKDVGLEVLLYAASERQISRALEKLGLRPGDGEIAALALGDRAAEALDRLAERAGFTRDDGVLRPRPEALDALGITDAERALFPPKNWDALVLERVALTDLWKG